MGFVKDDELEASFNRAIGQDAVEAYQAPFNERLKAAFALDNTIGSILNQQSGLPDSAKTTDFDVWDRLDESERMNESFLKSARYAENEDELKAVRLQYESEMKNRETLEVGGILPTLAAAIADPINLIPVGGVSFRTYKTGGSILDNALATGSAATISAGIVEAELHRTQLTRTYGESASNMTAAMFLGGILGAAPGAIRQQFGGAKLQELEESMNPEKFIAEGLNPSAPMGDRSLSAAAVDGDPQVRGRLAKWMAKNIRLDPLTRTLTSDDIETRRTVSALVESPIEVDADVGTAVESLIKIWDGNYYKAANAHGQYFREYLESTGKSSGAFNRLRNSRAFDEAVGKAVRNGSSDPIIQKAADAWNRELYEPVKKAAIDAGLLPPDVDVQTATNYLNRVYKTEVIAAERPKFVSVVKSWLDEENAAKIKTQQATSELADTLESNATGLSKASKSLDDLTKKIEAETVRLDEAIASGNTARAAQLETSLSKLRETSEELTTTLSKLEGDASDIIGRLEKTVSEMPSKTANAVRSALKGRDFQAASRAYKDLTKAVRSIVKANYDEVDTDRIANQIADRIISSPDGRLPYDYKIGDQGTGAGVKNNLSGPFQKRSFVIPDRLIEDFLESDITQLGQLYLRKVAPDIELTKRFGDVEMTTEFAKVRDSYTNRINATKNMKDRQKLEKAYKRDVEDLAGMRDRIRGVYRLADANNIWTRSGRVARDLNYMRLLGGVVASSIPDAARTIASEGIVRTFGTGLRSAITNIKSFKVAANEAKEWGIGVDTLMQGRAEIIAEIQDFSRGGNAFERGVRSAATKFSSINLMNQWTSGMKQLHGVVMQTRLIDSLNKGQIPRELKRLGINDDNAKNIAAELKKHAVKVDGLWLAKASEWDSPDLARMWGAALRKESDRVIIVPGQEKPLTMSTEMGKTIFQFKSFMTSATHRILIAGLQKQDNYFMQGAMSMITLGMMAYAFKEWDAGRELSDDPGVWVMEGIDRSGMLGIFMEANNTMEKVSGNSIGARGLLNLEEPASRYASRSALDSAVGPTFGLLGDVFRVVNATTQEGDWTDADTRAIRRLIPGQNLSLFRQALDKIEESIGDE